MKVDAMADLLG
jgi:hypothetical protein